MKKLFIFFTEVSNTDRSEDLTQYTREIKSRGIKTLAVGVGNETNSTELQATIASSSDHVFQLEKFEELCQGDLP